jgi:carbon storage regulator
VEEAGMLVLERKIQEGFWIEDRIYVKVLGIGRRRVKLGIEAPSESKVIREELRSRAGENGARGPIEKEAEQPQHN